jgi:hypothetical protein
MLEEKVSMKVTHALALLSLPLALASAAHAQTWVSNTGNDAGACTLAAPCKTFQRAVAETPVYGSIHVLNAGDYGPVVLSSPMEIDGGGLAAITMNGPSSSAAIAVNIGFGVAQIRNLSIHGLSGANQGIHFQGSGGIDIDHVQVTGIAGNCIWIATAGGSVDAVIRDTTVENCSQSGIYVMGGSPSWPTTAKIINTHVRFANGGITASSVTAVSAFSSTFSSPGQPTASTGSTGISIDAGNLLLDDCQVSGYGYGINSYAGNGQVSRSSFIDNWVAVSTSQGGTLVSNQNNAFLGNNSIGSFTSKVALQ